MMACELIELDERLDFVLEASARRGGRSERDRTPLIGSAPGSCQPPPGVARSGPSAPGAAAGRHVGWHLGAGVRRLWSIEPG